MLLVGFKGDGHLTVQSGATILATETGVYLGIDSAGTGEALVTGNNSRMSTNVLYLGGQDAAIGDFGALTVENDGAVDVSSDTTLWTSTSSITVNSGTFATGRLSNGNGVFATVSISDPAGSPALTVGLDDRTSSFAGLIQDATGGAGSLLKTGTGAFTLTGDNTYTGMTTISAGRLQVGTGGATGSIVGDVVNDGTLAFSRSGNLVFSGDVSGTGSLLQQGTGNLVLTGDHTHDGGTTISNGKLKIGSSGGTTGSITGNILNLATLVFQRSDTALFEGIISGTGELKKNAVGRLALTGVNIYTGLTTVNDGMLIAANTTGSATGTGSVLVTSNAFLGGDGSVDGTVTVNSGGSVVPNSEGIGTLTVGGVIFEDGSTLATDLRGTVDEFDELSVVATTVLDVGSTLDVGYFAAYSASPGDSFVILTAGTLSGEFSTVNYPDGQNWFVEYDHTGGTVTVGIAAGPVSTLEFGGIGQGGSVSLTVAGVVVTVPTSAGNTAAEVATLLAAAINADSILNGLGISASVQGAAIEISAIVNPGDVAIDDPGIFLVGVPAVPALSDAARGIALCLLLATGIVMLWAGKRTAPN